MFREQQLFLKQEIPVFNNLASSGNCRGRLFVTLKVYPTLQISWDFESIGSEACMPTLDENGRLQNDFIGHNFQLYDSFGAGPSFREKNDKLTGVNLQGVSSKASFGDEKSELNYFKFYLPNARFLHRSLEGRLIEAEYRLKYSKGEKPELTKALSTSLKMKSWECLVEDKLVFHLDSAVDDDWFRSQEAFGTYITGKVTLFSKKGEFGSITFKESKEIVEQVCWLFSFANGGYLGPVVIQAQDDFDYYDKLMEIGVYRTTPIELLGETWVTSETNICSLISCLPSFRKMILQDAWSKDLFQLILIWYFQAIQPPSAQEVGKPWPVVANALGAALERLSIAILRDELGEEPGKDLKQKIGKLLRKMGIKTNEDHKFTKVFVATRNNSTHPDLKGEHSREEMFLSLEYAKLWVEEVLLWRLGFDGAYRRRIPGSNRFAFEKPRYDLSTRKSDW